MRRSARVVAREARPGADASPRRARPAEGPRPGAPRRHGRRRRPQPARATRGGQPLGPRRPHGHARRRRDKGSPAAAAPRDGRRRGLRHAHRLRGLHGVPQGDDPRSTGRSCSGRCTARRRRARRRSRTSSCGRRSAPCGASASARSSSFPRSSTTASPTSGTPTRRSARSRCDSAACSGGTTRGTERWPRLRPSSGASSSTTRWTATCIVLDRATGHVRWSVNIGSPVESSPIVRRGVDYFGAWNGTAVRPRPRPPAAALEPLARREDHLERSDRRRTPLHRRLRRPALGALTQDRRAPAGSPA